MFSTYNYRPNNSYYTHKGQVIKRTARASPIPYKYSKDDILSLSQWLQMNDNSLFLAEPNPGNSEISFPNLFNNWTNVKLETTNSDNQNYNVSSSEVYHDYINNSIKLFQIKSNSLTTVENNIFTAAAVTVVQKPNNQIFIGCEFFSANYSNSNPATQSPARYSGDPYTYSSIGYNDKVQVFYFNTIYVTDMIYNYVTVQPNNFYIKTVNALTFDYNDQNYTIPINLSIPDEQLGVYNYIYLGVGFSSAYSGFYAFQDLTLATINKS